MYPQKSLFMDYLTMLYKAQTVAATSLGPRQPTHLLGSTASRKGKTLW